MGLAIGGLTLLAVASAALYWAWRRRVAAEVATGAEVDWELLQKTDPELLDGLAFEAFQRIYARANTPRGPAYLLAAGAAVVLGTAPILALLNGAVTLAERFGLTPNFPDLVGAVRLSDGVIEYLGDPTEFSRYLNFSATGFYMFFGLIGGWVAIAAFFASRYHRRRPGSLREEILRAR